MASQRKLASIMFADIVGYTALMQQDERQAKAFRDRHRSVVSNKIEEYDGELIQYYGDGALAIFNSAKESVLAAIDIQESLRESPQVPVRIGLHIADIVHDKDGVFGDGVNVASRIESMAVPGSVLLSERVFQEISNHPSIKVHLLGEFTLKNVKNPVKVFALKDDRLVLPHKDDLATGKHQQYSKCIAIMPFQYLGPADESDYFADGVCQEIVNGLSTVEGVSVISQRTCTAIHQSSSDPLEMGRQLNVAYFLEGSVRKAGHRIRVSTQLVNTADGFQVWGQTYNRDLDDIFEVQDEIAHHIVHALKLRFDISAKEEPIIPKVTEDVKAYTLHLKGMHLLRKNNPADAQKAIEKLDQALQIDPTFASAQCALSYCYSYLGSCGTFSPVDAYARALRYAMTAIENNPNLAEGHLAMAKIKFYHFWDWDGARQSLEKAEKLGLNSADLYQSYGLYFAAIGEPFKGVKKVEKALELDPLSVPIMSTLGTLYLFVEEYEKAISIFTDILELEPSFRGAHQYRAIALSCQGKQEEARREFLVYHEKVNHPKKAVAGLIITNHLLGEEEKSREYLQRLYDRLEEEQSAAVEIDIAISHAGIMEYDIATGFLERIYEKRLSIACMGMIWVMRCPYFKGYWSHPGYSRLLQKMGFEKQA